jgi:hypothetical protein
MQRVFTLKVAAFHFLAFAAGRLPDSLHVDAYRNAILVMVTNSPSVNSTESTDAWSAK